MKRLKDGCRNEIQSKENVIEEVKHPRWKMNLSHDDLHAFVFF